MRERARCTRCRAVVPELTRAGLCAQCSEAEGSAPANHHTSAAGLSADGDGIPAYERATVAWADTSEGPSLAAEASPTSGKLPRTFGDYELVEEIGRGGMGRVYKARQVSLNRTVALKVLLAGELASEEELRRFASEAKAAARLDHPGIVPVFDFGQSAGRHYFSMGFVQGQSLQQKLIEGPLAPREAAEMVRQVAEAIAYAHQHGVIHRDLKPANVLVDETGVPRVTDFGLAKRVEADGHLTATGQVLGTPSYMAPEQAAGMTRSADPAVDVYSLGAVLYALLTGRAPFQAASVVEILRQVMDREPVAPRQFDPSVPRDLETICLKCLQKDPRRRYPSARHLGEDLDRYLNGKPITARPVSLWEHGWRWVRRRPALAGLVVTSVLAIMALVGIAVGASYRRELEKAHRETEQVLEEAEAYLYFSRVGLAERNWWEHNAGRTRELLIDCPPDRRAWEWHYLDRLSHSEQMVLHEHDGAVRAVACSPDGRWIATADTAGTLRLWEAATGKKRAVREFPERVITDVAFTLDGQSIALLSQSAKEGPEGVDLWSVESLFRTDDSDTPAPRSSFRMPIGGRAQIAFTPAAELMAIACGLVETETRPLRVFQVGDGRELDFSSDGQESIRYFNTVAFSHDGAYLAAGGCNGPPADFGGEPKSEPIHLWDVKTGERIGSLAGHRGEVFDLAFSPATSLLASAGADQMVRFWDLGAMEETRTLRGHAGTIVSIAFAPDGARLATASEDGSLRTWETATGEPLLTKCGHAAGLSSVAWLPDGDRLVSGGLDGTVRVWDAAGSEETPLGQHQGTVHAVKFGRDPRSVVSAGADGAVYVWDTEAPEQRRSLGRFDQPVWSLDISPDGNLVAAAAGNASNPPEVMGEVCIWELSTGQEQFRQQAIPRIVWSVAFSPDGTRLAAAGGKSFDGPGAIIIWDRASGRWDHACGRELDHLPQPCGVRRVVFSPDGDKLAGLIVAGRKSRAEVTVWNLRTGMIAAEEIPASKNGCLAFSPDGRRLLVGDTPYITVWNVVESYRLYRPVWTFRGHTMDVLDVAFSPDGRRMASAGYDHAIKLWDWEYGQELLTLRGHTGPVWELAFSPDGHRLVSASSDRTIRLWDATPRPVLNTQFPGVIGGTVAGHIDGRRRDDPVRTYRDTILKEMEKF